MTTAYANRKYNNENPILTKEIFWNQISKKYPVQFGHFAAWVDEYKKRVDWMNLFNSNSDYQNSDGKNATAPKLHELPIAMQMGVFIQFTQEYEELGYAFEPDTSSMIGMINDVLDWFKVESNL